MQSVLRRSGLASEIAANYRLAKHRGTKEHSVLVRWTRPSRRRDVLCRNGVWDKCKRYRASPHGMEGSLLCLESCLGAFDIHRVQIAKSLGDSHRLDHS